MGIDPGSQRTGFGIVEENRGKVTYITSGTIVLDSDLPISDRLATLDTDLHSIISKHDPKKIAIETPFFAKNAQSAFRLGEVRGVILRRAAECKLEICEFAPSQMKAALGGSGRAQKDQIARLLRFYLQLPEAFEFQSLDQSDALAIAFTSAQTGGVSVKTARSGANSSKESKKSDRSTFWQTRT